MRPTSGRWVGWVSPCFQKKACKAVKVEAELPEIRDGILALMDKDLIPSASVGELKLVFYKMKGDCHRHLVKFTTSDAESKAAERPRGLRGDSQDRIRRELRNKLSWCLSRKSRTKSPKLRKWSSRSVFNSALSKRWCKCPFRRHRNKSMKWSRWFPRSTPRNATWKRLSGGGWNGDSGGAFRVASRKKSSTSQCHKWKPTLPNSWSSIPLGLCKIAPLIKSWTWHSDGSEKKSLRSWRSSFKKRVQQCTSAREPVIMQRQVPAVQTAQKTNDVLEARASDTAMDIPVVHQVPTS